MTRLADAEKLNGNSHWTIYNGKGGVYRATRDKSSGYWTARLTVLEWPFSPVLCSPTLRLLRQRIAADVA